MWALLLLAVAAGGYWLYQRQIADAVSTDAIQYTQAPVRTGTLDVTVYGSGMIQAASQPVVQAQTEGTLVALPVDIGDAVTEGQVLAVLENASLDEEIHTLEYALWDLDSTITNAFSAGDVTAIKSPSAGRVMKLYAKAGDDALAVYREHGSVALISTDGRMKVSFDVTSGQGLALGDSVTVAGDGFAREATITELYLQGTKATATILDDALPLDAPVSIEYEGRPIGAGSLRINKPMAVSAFGGTIQDVRVSEGDTISQMVTIYTLKDAPNSLEQESLRMQRESAADSLETAVEKRESLIVTSPAEGTVATVAAAIGDGIQSGTALMTLIEGEEMVLTIAVDELDVVSVAPGQPVTITVDALPDLALTGTVEKIAPVGTGSNGVSTYDVLLNFSAEGTGVRPGMNASGEVLVAQAEGALYIPIEALMTIGDRTYVMVAGGETDGSVAQAQGAPGAEAAAVGTGNAERADVPSPRSDGEPAAEGMTRGERRPAAEGRSDMATAADGGQRSARMAEAQLAATTTTEGTLREVTTGLMNDDSVQILSGLSAGEVVLYQTATGASSSYSANMASRMSGGGSSSTSTSVMRMMGN